MRRRSSARPCTLGRLETPPAPNRLTPGRLRNRLAVSLLAARPDCSASASALLAPTGSTATRGALMVMVCSEASWANVAKGKTASRAHSGRRAGANGRPKQARERWGEVMAVKQEEAAGAGPRGKYPQPGGAAGTTK